MNGLEIIVFGIIAVSCFMGYRAGFLRVIYSLFSWLLVLAFVTWSTPYLTAFLENNTSMQSVIEQKCISYLEEKAQEYSEEKAQDAADEEIWISQDIAEEIAGFTGEAVSGILQTSGVYEELAKVIAHFIIEGIAFFIAFIIAGIFAHWINGILNLVAHLPVLHGVNKALGAALGSIKGLLIVWLLFYVITLFRTSEIGTEILIGIKESPLLLFLYKNNILMQIIMIFL